MIALLNKIIRFPEIIPKDKRLHFLCGAVLASLLSFFTPTLYIIILGVIISVGLEFYQRITKSGQFEYMDMLATFLGFLVVLLPQLYKGV